MAAAPANAIEFFHGYTYSGHPLASAACIATLDLYRDEDLFARAKAMQEQNAAGAQEIIMPTIQSGDLWKESGRYDDYGPEMLRIKDRHERDMLYGPTHEEVITDFARQELKSYRQLPINFYQIQTKFRDEIRPRFGIMRAREFMMKDAYSFHLAQDCLETTYQAMYDAYSRIFSRLGLEFRAVNADTGNFGGFASHARFEGDRNRR